MRRSPNSPALDELCVAGLIAAAGLASLTGLELPFAALVVFTLGLPHGATDLRHVAAGERLAFVVAYLLAAVGVLLLWEAAPGAALAAFLLLSVAHFAGDAPTGEGAAVSLAIVGGPAVLHRHDVAGLFEGLGIDGRHAAATATALVVAGAAGAAVMAWTILRRPERRWALLPGAVSALLLPPLPGLATAFVLLHAWPALRGQAGASALGHYLRGAAPVMAGAAGVCAVAVSAFKGRPLPEAAALFGALSALATPHMLVTPLWARVREPATA